MKTWTQTGFKDEETLTTEGEVQWALGGLTQELNDVYTNDIGSLHLHSHHGAKTRWLNIQRKKQTSFSVKFPFAETPLHHHLSKLPFTADWPALYQVAIPEPITAKRKGKT